MKNYYCVYLNYNVRSKFVEKKTHKKIKKIYYH